MDAERVECVSAVQPAAAQEDGRPPASHTLDAEEEEDGGGRHWEPEPRLPQSSPPGGQQEDVTCDLKPCIQSFKAWTPTVYSCFGKEHLWFAGYEITIQESIEGYAGVIWPAAKALCNFLEENQYEYNLRNKKVLEIGSGTGLVSIVACILGAQVIATDMPDVLGNLKFNLSRNTRGRYLHVPEVKPLVWGQDLETNYPQTTCIYDYILAADVVYHHTCLDQLLDTMKHLCQPGTELIWANKFRFNTDFDFLMDFNKAFKTEVLAEFCDLEVKIFKAKYKVD
ncbi:protein-lysine methyltransferase METTL21C-like [Gastrophryne carolinensis]